MHDSRDSRHVVLLALPHATPLAKPIDHDRGWSAITLPRIRRYARRLNATVSVVRTADAVPVSTAVRRAWATNVSGEALDALRRTYGDRSAAFHPVGRGNATVYVLKLLAVAQALRRHARVLLIDDSAFVTPGAASIFDACPEGADVCGFSEGVSAVDAMQVTWMYSKKHVLGVGHRARPAMYFNTGVLVFGQGARRLLRPERVAAGLRAGLFAGPCPEQEYLCAELSAHNCSTHRLDRAFNYMPTLRQMRLVRDGVELKHKLSRPPRPIAACAPAAGRGTCAVQLAAPLVERAQVKIWTRSRAGALVDRVQIFHLTGLAASAYVGSSRSTLFEHLNRTLPTEKKR